MKSNNDNTVEEVTDLEEQDEEFEFQQHKKAFPGLSALSATGGYGTG